MQDDQLRMDLLSTGSALVRELARLLRLSVTTRALGHIYLHTFYSAPVEGDVAIERLLAYPLLDVAMASVFLAGKVNEEIRRVRDVVNAGYYLFHCARRIADFVPFPYVCDAYYQWRERVTRMEMRLLFVLGFRTHRILPYAYMVSYLKSLDLLQDRVFSQRALNHVNDGFLVATVALEDPPQLACLGIHLAAQTMRTPLPTDWHVVFDVNAASLERMSDDMQRLYKQQDVRRLIRDLPLTPRELHIFGDEYEREVDYQRHRRHRRHSSPHDRVKG